MASTETTEELYTVIKNDPACLVFHNKTPAFLPIPLTVAFSVLIIVGLISTWPLHHDKTAYILNDIPLALSVILLLSLIAYVFNRYELLFISPIGVAQRIMIVGKTAIRWRHIRRILTVQKDGKLKGVNFYGAGQSIIFDNLPIGRKLTFEVLHRFIPRLDEEWTRRRKKGGLTIYTHHTVTPATPRPRRPQQADGERKYIHAAGFAAYVGLCITLILFALATNEAIFLIMAALLFFPLGIGVLAPRLIKRMHKGQRKTPPIDEDQTYDEDLAAALALEDEDEETATQKNQRTAKSQQP